MNIFKIILKSIRYYKKEHLLVLIGIIISTAVLTGALIIGDSVKYSLQDIVFKRLGNTKQVLQAHKRFFPADLSERFTEKTGIKTASILNLKGLASSDDSDLRLSDVNIIGINEKFKTISHNDFPSISEDEIIINQQIANDLHVSINDELLIRVEKAGFVSLNAPFVPDEENTVSLRMKVKEIVGAENFGNFNLKTDQITPYNIFISQEKLSSLFFKSTFANTILISDNDYTIDEINNSIKAVWTVEDINLHLRDIPKSNKIELFSDRIFIENKIYEILKNSDFEPKPVFSYLVNFMRLNHKETPYSFVSSIEDTTLYHIDNNTIIINKWMADDLNAAIGDRIELEYFKVGNLRKLIEEKKQFIISDIVEIEGFAADSMLMPAFEGLADVDNCSDWEAGIPMDYSKIRDKDEEYWNIYRGTPKAFISYAKAKDIWNNTQGDITAIRFNSDITESQISELLTKTLNPSEVGLTIYDVKKESLWSANNAVDFAQLFLGLSFFLILAAFILTGLLFSLLLNSRKKEQGIYLSIGISQKKIRKIFLSEGIVIAIIGSFIGVFVGIILNQVVLYFLNTIWYDIVRTSSISMHIKPLTLLVAFISNTLIAWFVIWLTIKKRMKQNINTLNREITNSSKKQKKRSVRMPQFIFFIGAGIFILLLGWSLYTDIFQNSNLFFLNGFILLAVLISGIYILFNKRKKKNNSALNNIKLSFRNLLFYKKQNLSTISILAIGIFIVTSTGINRVDFHRNSKDVNSGTGGYQYYIETNIPINADLNSREGLLKHGLDQYQDSTSFVQFSALNGDDASCLNLNRTIRPGIIGFNPSEFIEKDAFSFVKTIENNNSETWNLLNKKLGNNCIPAIADQTVIKWGLGKAVGDSIAYLNDQGDTIHLVLVGGLANSVFQGKLIISEDNFKKHYSSIVGSRILLADNKLNSISLHDDLLRTFRNTGIKIENTADRLEMFNSVTNTYLDIFLALGGIALILSTFGVSIVLIRNISEQEHFFAMMQAIGIKKKQILKIIRIQHSSILIIGCIIGLLSALIASMPALLSGNIEIPYSLLILIISIFLITGLFWIIMSSKLNLKGSFIQKLKNE